MAGNAVAANNNYSLQYDGFGIKAEFADKHEDASHYFVGANFVNHGPSKECGNLCTNVKDRYGDHSADANDPTKWNTKKNVALTYTQDIFVKALNDKSEATPKSFDIIGAGLVYGSQGSTIELGNQANLTGNVDILLKDIVVDEQKTGGVPHITVQGGGSVHSSVGSATVTGDIHVKLQNVQNLDGDVYGAGSIQGPSDDPSAPQSNADASVTGNITLDLIDSAITLVNGGGDISGDDKTTGANGDVNGNITINLTNTQVKAGRQDDLGALIGGSNTSNKGVADVKGNIAINLKNSSVDLLIGGGVTADELYEDDPKSVAGHSAQVTGDININLDGTTVNRALVAGGVTDPKVYYDQP